MSNLLCPICLDNVNTFDCISSVVNYKCPTGCVYHIHKSCMANLLKCLYCRKEIKLFERIKYCSLKQCDLWITYILKYLSHVVT